MKVHKVEFIDCPAGDWTVVKLDGELFAEGHSVNIHMITDLLSRLGVDVLQREISDEDMENGKILMEEYSQEQIQAWLEYANEQEFSSQTLRDYVKIHWLAAYKQGQIEATEYAINYYRD